MARIAVKNRRQPMAGSERDAAARHETTANEFELRLGDLSFEPEDQRVAVERILRRTIDGLE